MNYTTEVRNQYKVELSGCIAMGKWNIIKECQGVTIYLH